MSSIIPFAAGAKLPAYLAGRAKGVSAINADIVTHTSYPVLSIKGKVFTLVKGKEKKVLMREDDADEVRQSLNLTVVRANTKSRVFYAKAYAEGAEGEDARPDCYSADSIAPGADAKAPQAKKCQLCPNAVWGTGNNGVGTRCSVNTRLAVVDADSIMHQAEVEPYLLRVPAGSRANFADVVKAADGRGIDYNMMALKVAFDKEAPSPKLTFKLVGLLDDDAYARVNALYADETVLDIVGLAPVRAQREAPAALPAPSVTEDDLDAALAARAEATTKKAQAEAAARAAVAKASAKPEVTTDELDALMGEAVAQAEAEVVPPKPPAKAAKAKAEAKPAPAADDDLSGLMGDLDDLLGATDD